MKILEVKDVYSGYGGTEVLHGVSIHLNEGEIITIIGPNGAGKSTLLKTIMGYLRPTQGEILLREEDVTTLRPDEKVRRGIGYVPQLENVFPSLTVEENLEMGGYVEDKRRVGERIEEAYELFPVLRERRRQREDRGDPSKGKGHYYRRAGRLSIPGHLQSGVCTGHGSKRVRG